jgi:transposase
MGNVQNKIDLIDADLRRKMSSRQNRLKIAMFIPGIEFTSATTILPRNMALSTSDGLLMAASKKIGSKLRSFYLRERSRRGANVAIVAPARKILCILCHLLTNQEMYEEPGAEKRTRPNRFDQLSPQREFTAREMIDILKGNESRKLIGGHVADMPRYQRLCTMDARLSSEPVYLGLDFEAMQMQ